MATPTIIVPGAGYILLNRVSYGPASASSVCTSSSTYSVVDSTHLTIPFTVISTKAMLIFACYVQAATSSFMEWAVGPHGGSVDTTTQMSMTSNQDGGRYTARFYLTGLTPGNAYQYDWYFASSDNSNSICMFFSDGQGSNHVGPAVMEAWSL